MNCPHQEKVQNCGSLITHGECATRMFSPLCTGVAEVLTDLLRVQRDQCHPLPEPPERKVIKPGEHRGTGVTTMITHCDAGEKSLNKRELLLTEVQHVPEPLLDELLDFVEFLKTRSIKERAGAALASESSLKKD